MKKDTDFKQITIPAPVASMDEVAALRLLIVYFTTFEEKAGDEIMRIANGLYAHAIFEDKPSIRRAEGREGGGVAQYHRANPDLKILINNYHLMRTALALWLEERSLKNTLPDFVISLQRRVFVEADGSDYYFDPPFFRASFGLDNKDGRAVMRRVADEHAGFWLVYRMSTAEPKRNAGGAPVRPYVNVSLLRITPFEHLKDEDHSPKFLYEFRTGMKGRSHRAEGYLYRTGGHINAIGRRTSTDNRAVVTFSWRTPEVVLSEPAQHLDEIRSLGYATDSEGVRIGFLFIAKHIPGTENIAQEHYARVRDVYQSLIGRYEMPALLKRMSDFPRDETVAALGSVPPHISEDEYDQLLKQSTEEAVLKQQE
jgi:hypothetical protein